MGTIYFLVFVAVCALAVAWFIFRSHRRRPRVDRRKQRHTEPLYRHRQTSHGLLHSHTGHLPSESHDIWRTRRPHANEEHWDHASSTMTAHHIRSDAEPEPESEAEHEMTMSTIKYTPQKAPRTGSDRN